MKRKRTDCGFKMGEFVDIFGHPCSIQESALANYPALWLGRHHETIHQARMHLDRRLAKQLIRHLTRFVETGRL